MSGKMKGRYVMPELIEPIEDFKRHLTDYTSYDFIDFGSGLIVVFTDEKVNIRQYHNNGNCLSSWVEKEEFFKKIGRHSKEEISIE